MMMRAATRRAASSASLARSAPAAASAAGLRALSGKAKAKSSLKFEGNLGKYAHSLFNVAKDGKQVDTVAKELKLISAQFEKDNVLSALKNPLMSQEELVAKVDSWTSKGSGKGLSAPVKKLVKAMATRGHLLTIPKVEEAFNALVREEKGIVSATVTSAVPLSKKQLADLDAALKTHLEKGQTVEINSVVDPSILGGLKVVLGSQYADLSAVSRVRQYDAWIRSRTYEWLDGKVKSLQKSAAPAADKLAFK